MDILTTVLRTKGNNNKKTAIQWEVPDEVLTELFASDSLSYGIIAPCMPCTPKEVAEQGLYSVTRQYPPARVSTRPWAPFHFNILIAPCLTWKSWHRGCHFYLQAPLCYSNSHTGHVPGERNLIWNFQRCIRVSFKGNLTVSHATEKHKRQYELSRSSLQAAFCEEFNRGRWTPIKQNYVWDLTLCDPNSQLKHFEQQQKCYLTCSHQSTVNSEESPAGKSSLLNRCYRMQQYGAERKTIL